MKLIKDKVILKSLVSTVQNVVISEASGLLASNSLIIGKLSNSTTIALLVDIGNWTSKVYTGTAITDTYEGMYYANVDYYFYCYSDNIWIRTALV